MPPSVCLLLPAVVTPYLFVDKVSHCTLELQIEPGAEADDDEVRSVDDLLC